MSLPSSLSEIQHDIDRKLLLSTYGYLPHLYLAPLLGVTPLKFRQRLWRQKTRVPIRLCGVVCVIVHLAILAEL